MRKQIILILILAMLSSCHRNEHEEVVRECYTIAKKHEEQVCITNHGGFRTDYYFYMTNSSLKEVEDLETYLSYDVGDEVCFTHTIWVEDKPNN
jgi:hypothetical protein